MLLFVLPFCLFSQGKFTDDLHVGGFLGITNYSGDLAEKKVDLKYTRPTLGLMVRKDINRYLTVRVGFNWGVIAGADSTNSDSLLKARNLNFRSNVFEGTLMAEFNFFDILEKGYTPYVFAGIGVFSFFPTTEDSAGGRVPLRRLSTEGQGMPEYPERTQYNLIQVSIPFGAGVKVMLNDVWTVGAEIGLRKTFTDYLDDVSLTYVDEDALRNFAGQKAVDYAWRGDEVDPKKIVPGPYPADGTIRGSDKHKDWYMFSGLTITYRLGGSSGNGFGRQKFSRCPTY